MSSTVADKAARALLEGRITVRKISPAGLAVECRSAHSGARYLAAVYRDDIGVRRSCTCPNGKMHPFAPRCWHAAACALLSDRDEVSDR